MPKRRTPASVITLVLTITLGMSLPGVGGGERPNPTGTIFLGGIFNLKGEQAVLDVPSALGAQLAVDQVNGNGGLLGRRVELIIEDGQSRPKKLNKNTIRILKKYPSVAGFLGLSDTDMLLAAAPPAVDAGRVFLTSGATSPLLPGQVPPSLYLACFGDNVQAAAAAEYAYNTLGAVTASVLYDSSDTYTILLQGYFRTRFEQLGGTIIDVEEFQGQELAGPIGQLSPADVIFFSAAPPAAFDGVDQLRSAGFTAPILGGDGFDSEDEWAARPSVSDVFFTTHVYLGSDNPDPEIAGFRSAYQAAYPGADLNAFAALGYDAASLLMEAIREGGSADPADVLAILPTLDIQGVTGEISYADGSGVPLKSVSIIAINGGLLSLSDQFIPTSVPAP